MVPGKNRCIQEYGRNSNLTGGYMAVSGKKTEALKRKLAEIYDILLKTYGPQK